VPLAPSPLPSSEESSDDHLLSLSTAGDAPALGRLYDRHGGRALHLASAICLDPHRAELVVEQAFAAVRSGPADTSTYPRPSSWLLTLVSRYALSAARDDRLRSPLTSLSDAQAEAIALARYGRLTSLEIADQLNVTSREIKQLIREGLHELRAATRHPTPLGSVPTAARPPAPAPLPVRALRPSVPAVALMLASTALWVVGARRKRNRRTHR